MKQRSAPRRATLAFLGGCAGVLAAGMALVSMAGLSTPGRQVSSHSALPVYNALGAESSNVQFWPCNKTAWPGCSWRPGWTPRW